MNALHRAVLVCLDGGGIQAFREHGAFFQGLLHFLVVEGVGGAVDEPAPVGDGNAAPVLQEFQHAGCPAFVFGMKALLPDFAGVVQELLGNLALLGIPAIAHGVLADALAQALVALQKLLHLHHVVGEGLGGRVDGSQASADHHHGKPHLHIGDGVRFRRAG